MNKRLISIITPCFNEEESVGELYRQVEQVRSRLNSYAFEHIFIDNASTDRTVDILKELARKDQELKIIINESNYGDARSPYHALLQASGNAAIVIACDLEDPPALITDFISYWEDGVPLVVGIKSTSEGHWIMRKLRELFYSLLSSFSDVEQIKNFSGYALYDRRIIEELRKLNEPYPYLRGLIAELGFRRQEVKYHKPIRKAGKSKNNLSSLFNLAVLGFVNHSGAPLRLVSLIGFVTAIFCFFVGIFYLIYKLLYWDQFEMGVAPVIIGLFFIAAVQLISVGILGEYVRVVLTKSSKRPLVIERERVNFDDDESL